MPKATNNKIDSALLSEIVVAGMQEVKAEDIVVIDLRGLKDAEADFFVICSVNSDPQADGVCDSIEEEVYKAIKLNPSLREGRATKEWMIVDYFDVVAHVFKKNKREFFNLERLWADGVIKTIENVA